MNAAHDMNTAHTATETSEPVSFVIPAYRTEEVKAKVKKLGRKAKKLGLPMPIVEFGEAWSEKYRDEFGFVRHKQMREARIIGSGVVKVEGYTFLAALDHGPAGTIVRALVEGDFSQWRDADPKRCDHCKTRRKRNSTYVLRAPSGALLQVGSRCLVDFLGHDATRIVAHAQYERELRTFDDDDFGFGSGGGKRDMEIDDYLMFVATISRTQGFVTRKRAREIGGEATAGLALSLRWTKPSERKRRGMPEPTQADADRANAAIEWARKLEGRSDFEHNLKTVALQGYVPLKQVGIAAYIVEAYSKHLNKEAEQKARAEKEAKLRKSGVEPKHLGTVGKRQVFERVTLVRESELESDFGVTVLHVFETEDTSRIVWFGSKHLGVERGSTVDIKATVKRHETYNGKPQTIVNRVTLV